MSFSDGVFWTFAVIAVLPAFLILFSKSIVRMAFLLLFSLAGFAGLYLQIGAGFLGFTQVLVYIGGILILFLFGVMLTAKTDVPVRERMGLGLALPGVVAGLMTMGALLFFAVGNGWVVRPQPAGPLPPEAPAIGLKFLGAYILPFEAVSILLLAAMVGATYIARGKEEVARGEAPERKG